MGNVSRAAAVATSADDLAIHRQAIARAPVLSRERQASISRRLRVERDAFVSAALEAPEVVATLLERWRALRAAGRSTGVLSVHHVEGTDRDLSAEIDRSLARADRLFARSSRAPAAAGRRRVARALRDAELSVEAIVQAFHESAGGSPDRAAAAAAFAAYAETRDMLVRHNLRLVIRFARPFRVMQVPLADLVQEGCIGLMRAVEKFDPERGLSFSTYAAWWIHQALIRTVQRESRTVRVPSTVYEQQIRYRRAEEALRATAGEASRSDVAQLLGLAPEEADRIVASGLPITSTDTPIGDSDSLVVEDTLADESCVDPGAICDLRVFAGAIPALLAALSERERAVLTARFGLEGEDAATLTEVGARLGLSRERVRQIEFRALARMRVGPVARDLVSWRSAPGSPA
jgi:RNA polymerase primary sigma factor